MVRCSSDLRISSYMPSRSMLKAMRPLPTAVHVLLGTELIPCYRGQNHALVIRCCGDFGLRHPLRLPAHSMRHDDEPVRSFIPSGAPGQSAFAALMPCSEFRRRRARFVAGTPDGPTVVLAGKMSDLEGRRRLLEMAQDCLHKADILDGMHAPED